MPAPFSYKPLITLTSGHKTVSGMADAQQAINETTGVIDKLMDHLKVISSEAAYREAVYLLPFTKELVPVNKGWLQASGRVETFPVESLLALAAIVYGGPAGSTPEQEGDVDYAIPVHEDLNAYHEVGQAKYVEAVVRRNMTSGDSRDRMNHTYATLLAEYERTGRVSGPRGMGVRPTRGRPPKGLGVGQTR